ncbi:hypothetical protein D5S17_27790 [Pseudonocardiaceae bacterium YIM PH 21723]|nr:hypothetical protein D5S17_27790 [Pseudonocardiaceae bacterium YIM PH 21723]
MLSNLAVRANTRVLIIYGMAGRLPADVPATPIAELWDFDRFSGHLAASAELLPNVVLDEYLDGAALTCAGSPLPLDLGRLRVFLLKGARGETTAMLDVTLPADVDHAEVSTLLATTCFDRAELRIGDRSLPKWLADRLADHGIHREVPFERDVHQMVFPGGELQQRVHQEDSGANPFASVTVSDIVHRGVYHESAATHLPPALNIPGTCLVGHGRGVAVIAGWNAHVENVLAVIGTLFVSALGLLRAARKQAHRAVLANEQGLLTDTSDARELVAELSERLGELQLDLSFGVEAYLDNLLIPELIVESFHSSLRDALGLPDILSNTSRMLARVGTVVQARMATLEAAVADATERRNKVLSAMVAIGTLLALPPALLLAFFGVNGTEVNDTASITDLDHYWPAYVLATMPFILLVGVGSYLYLRIRPNGD